VEGHTDSLGTDARNLQLSQQRSESVKNWLLQNNITTADKIQIYAFGKWRPVASNKTSQGRAQNRRVEMIILRKSKK
jgi:outer membrane protein OmpA-like peptidoglycan-associated protein